MKTLIAIPCMDMVPVKFTEAIVSLDKPQGTFVSFRPNSLIYDSRNLLYLTAKENNMDRILWLDSDMVFEPDILRRMHEDMDTLNCEMLTGVYIKRAEPYTPVLFDTLEEPGVGPDGNPVQRVTCYVNYPEDQTFPVKGCGFGCVMMTVDLIHRVWQKFGPAFNPYPWASEDISFCHRVNQLGVQIWCDSRIQCGHVGQFTYTDKICRGGRK